MMDREPGQDAQGEDQSSGQVEDASPDVLSAARIAVASSSVASSSAVDPFWGFPAAPLTPLEAIERRHSVRAYTDRPLDGAAVEALQAAIESVNGESCVSIQLVQDEPCALAGFKSRMVGFSGARNYLALVGPDCKGADTILGYCGEKLVLFAQALGLNSCWVGGTYRMAKEAFSVDIGQKLFAIIVLGYGEDQGTPHASKPPEAVCPSYEAMPTWFQQGVQAALLAPSALNQQKFSFALVEDDDEELPVVRSRTKRGPFAKMDQGIAQCHFEIGTGDVPFLWGER